MSDDPYVDPEQVEWDFPIDLPNNSEYGAAIAQAGKEDVLVDLLYSSLAGTYTHNTRMFYFGIMATNPRGSDEFRAAERDLRKLTAEMPTPDIYGGVIPGKAIDNVDVVGVVLFYEKENITEEEVTDGNGNSNDSDNGTEGPEEQADEPEVYLGCVRCGLGSPCSGRHTESDDGGVACC